MSKRTYIVLRMVPLTVLVFCASLCLRFGFAEDDPVTIGFGVVGLTWAAVRVTKLIREVNEMGDRKQ